MQIYVDIGCVSIVLRAHKGFGGGSQWPDGVVHRHIGVTHGLLPWSNVSIHAALEKFPRF